MSGPVRIQLSRRRYWRKPANTVSVARPTKWGNPERVVRDQMQWDGETYDDAGEPVETGPWLCLRRGSTYPPQELKSYGGWWFSTEREAAEKAVEMYRFRLTTDIASCRLPIADQLAELRGKNLACWCALDQPCHADVLLELANAPENETPPAHFQTADDPGRCEGRAPEGSSRSAGGSIAPANARQPDPPPPKPPPRPATPRVKIDLSTAPSAMEQRVASWKRKSHENEEDGSCREA